MNGLPSRLQHELRERHSLRELVWDYLVSGNGEWNIDLMKLSFDDGKLFNIGILSIVEGPRQQLGFFYERPYLSHVHLLYPSAA
jgi:hypothetical protein